MCIIMWPRRRGDLLIFGLFTSLLLVCGDADRRQVIIPALAGLRFVWAVGITGVAFLSQAGRDGVVLHAGASHALLVDGPLRVEVEGSTSVLIAYSCADDDSSTGGATLKAKKRVAFFVDARNSARAEWAPAVVQERKRRRDESGPDAATREEPEQEAPESEEPTPLPHRVSVTWYCHGTRGAMLSIGSFSVAQHSLRRRDRAGHSP